MAIVDKFDALSSISARKKISLPNGYGEAIFGFSQYGHDNINAGIYQQRQGLDGKITAKLKFYVPTNPQTVPQQANRSVFANAVSGWQSLTAEQKLAYNKSAVGKQMSGYNFYIKEFMLNN